MASPQPIVTVSLTLNTGTINRQGFGTIAVIASHNNFLDAYRVYEGVSAVGADFDVDSKVYKIAQELFSQQPPVPRIIVGKRTNTPLLRATTVVEGNNYRVSVTVSSGMNVVAETVADSEDTPETIATALSSAIVANASISDEITVAVTGGGFTITPKEGGAFYIDELINVSESSTDAVSGTQAFKDLVDATSDFYFVISDDHTPAYVQELSDATQAASRLYFTSTQDFSVYSALTDASSDIGAILLRSGNTRTILNYLQTADTTFPEASLVGGGAPYAPDEESIVWSGMTITGSDISRNSSGGALTADQIKNLSDRNINYFNNDRSVSGVYNFGGKTVSGAWIDDIHIGDNIVARVTEDVSRLFLGKGGATKRGAASGKSIPVIRGAIEGALTRFIGSNALSSYQVDFSGIIFDSATRRLKSIKFRAVTENAVIAADISGELINGEVTV